MALSSASELAGLLDDAGVELAHQGQLALLQSRRRFGRLGVGDAGHGGLEDRALVGGGEEAAVEVVQPAGRDQAAVEDDEAGQVLALAAQAVGGPGAHAGPALQAGAGVEEVVGVGVLGKFAGHRADERQLVHDLGHVREQIADPRPALAVPAELPRRLHHLADVGELRRLQLAHRLVRVLAVELLQQRLVVEGIHLRRAAVHVEEDDALRLGRVVRQARRRRRPDVRRGRRQRFMSAASATRRSRWRSAQHLPAGVRAAMNVRWRMASDEHLASRELRARAG